MFNPVAASSRPERHQPPPEGSSGGHSRRQRGRPWCQNSCTFPSVWSRCRRSELGVAVIGARVGAKVGASVGAGVIVGANAGTDVGAS